jgi:hypothetical protein
MKRTPMLRGSRPAVVGGHDFRWAVRCSSWLLLSSDSSVSRNLLQTGAHLSIFRTLMSDQKRPYRMKRRAELEEQTRLRITESAVALHERIGPAQTSISRNRGPAPESAARRSTALPGRGRAVRGLLVALPLPEPRARPSCLGGDRRGRRANRNRSTRAVRVLRTHAPHVREPLPRREPVPAVRRRLRDFHGYLEAARDA